MSRLVSVEDELAQRAISLGVMAVLGDAAAPRVTTASIEPIRVYSAIDYVEVERLQLAGLAFEQYRTSRLSPYATSYTQADGIEPTVHLGVLLERLPDDRLLVLDGTHRLAWALSAGHAACDCLLIERVERREAPGAVVPLPQVRVRPHGSVPRLKPGLRSHKNYRAGPELVEWASRYILTNMERYKANG